MSKDGCRKIAMDVTLKAGVMSIVGNSVVSSCIIIFVLLSFFDRYNFQEHSLKLPDKAKQHLTFRNLVNHLGHLITGPTSIADITKKELQCRFAERESLVKSTDCRKTLGTLYLNIWKDISAFVPF